ncbi:MAG: DNA-processing protein DprA [Burkholderiaceae bacterium]|jgi:DNA processing protein|nr:DNA-processing protein DprA [Burkholderiaceae bacterium]
MDRGELTGWLRLALTPGVGDASVRRLLAAFGPPEVIFAQPAAALRQLLTPAQVGALAQTPLALAQTLDATLNWLAASGQDGAQHAFVTLGDARYPAALLAIEDPPPMLYLLGQLPGENPSPYPPALAVVGSRNPTPQGALNARQFARALCEAGLTVVSGLALGIDGAAHEGALQAAGGALPSTIAVIGTGIDRVYPSHHRELAHRIARQGLIVSEYSIGTPPLAANFPKRNRLIAGLALGALVVEAAPQSGSLITARLAVEQGKEVFAIPGSIHSAQSRGCHQLIRQGAKLVETAQDVLEELPQAARAMFGGAAEVPAPAPAAPDTVPDADGLLRALGADPVSLDALQARTGLATPVLQARLLELELQGQLGRLPGGLFQRLGQS